MVIRILSHKFLYKTAILSMANSGMCPTNIVNNLNCVTKISPI